MPHCKVYLKHIWSIFLVCYFELSFFYDSRDANSSSERLMSIKKSVLSRKHTALQSLFEEVLNQYEALRLNWRQFCQHFLKSTSKILATSDVDHSKCTLPSCFKNQLNVVFVPKAWNTQTYLETVLSAFFQIDLPNFGNLKCWPFQIHFS